MEDEEETLWGDMPAEPGDILDETLWGDMLEQTDDEICLTSRDPHLWWWGWGSGVCGGGERSK